MCQRASAEATSVTGGCLCAGRMIDADCIDLTTEVVQEAQIGALYALWAAYHTQHCVPLVRIYIGPSALSALASTIKVPAPSFRAPKAKA
jgi:hypothetical protein